MRELEVVFPKPELMACLHNVPGVPADILMILYDWQRADEQELSRAKQYFLGCSEILFDLSFYGDVDDGSALIDCTVLEKAGEKGNLNVLGEIVIDGTGWRFTAVGEEGE